MRWLIVLLSLFPLVSLPAAETFFIADFLDAQKRWSELSGNATAIHLQGRPEQIARTRLKFYKSDLVLRSLDNTKLPVVPRDVQTIEVRGRLIKAGDTFGSIESVKAVSELFAPMSGEVIEVNPSLKDHPEVVNSKPHETWMVKVRVSDPNEAGSLLDSAQYEALTNA